MPACSIDRPPGGVYGLLAGHVLSRGGVVAGAAWADGCRELRHILVEREDDLDPIMRSKYVQSSVGREVYVGVRGALRAGRPALFAGTACQVAGMRSYLGRLADSDLFLGVDVICHGVPSPALWRRWLAYVGSRDRGEVRGVNFRSKVTGWQSYSVAYDFASKRDGALCTSAMRFSDDWYMRAFLNNASLRASCLDCPFKRRCGSDVTLGDYWGIRRHHPEVSVEGGVSAVVCSTGKGVDAICRISDLIESGSSSLDKVVSGNPSFVQPVRPYADRDSFMAAVAEGVAISDMMERWDFEPPFKQRLVSSAKHIVKRMFRWE